MDLPPAGEPDDATWPLFAGPTTPRAADERGAVMGAVTTGKQGNNRKVVDTNVHTYQSLFFRDPEWMENNLRNLHLVRHPLVHRKPP